MKILFVTPGPPHLLGGGGSRMYHQLKYLKKEKVDVDLLTFAEPSAEITDEIKDLVDNIHTVECRDNVTSRLKNLFLLKAYSKDKKFETVVNDIFGKNKYDLIHVHKFQMAEYFVNVKDIPLIIDLWACGLKGAWYEVWYECNILRKLIKLLRIPRFYLADRKFYAHYKYFFVVSEEARDYILKRYKNKKVYIVPSGVDTESFPSGVSPNNKTLIFTGDMSFFPNVDTVLYFVERIYPKIKNKIKNVKFYIVGRNPSKKVSALAVKDKSIIVTGYVSNIYDYLKNSSIFVAPIRSGLGIRNKILEALAFGLPVVATRNACEGIEVENNHNIVFAETPLAFANAVIELLNNSQKRIMLGKNSGKLIEEKYQWKHIVSKMIEYYNEILNSDNLKR
ncbi:MAG: glycosyltransferase family 4 protein [Elusimicrobiota bacterium]